VQATFKHHIFTWARQYEFFI